jgi:hypothetical protein
VVNFQKGERQINIDYLLCQALNYNSEEIGQAIVCYNIACQFFTNFHDWVKQSPYLSVPRNISIKKAISLFHIHGHQDDCFSKYLLNFILGISQVDGKIIEILWSQLNEVLESTRSMSTFHC